MNAVDRKGCPDRMRNRFARRASAKLAIGLVAASLAVPAAAAAYTVPGDPTAPSHPGSAHGTPGLVLHRDGSKAVPLVADRSARDASTGGGFDWGDAMIGAGAALGTAALAGAGVTLRRRSTVELRSATS